MIQNNMEGMEWQKEKGGTSTTKVRGLQKAIWHKNERWVQSKRNDHVCSAHHCGHLGLLDRPQATSHVLALINPGKADGTGALRGLNEEHVSSALK